MQNNHGSDVIYHWTVEQHIDKMMTHSRRVIESEASALEELLLASHAQLAVKNFEDDCPTLTGLLLEAQDKARQALRWGEYAQKA